MTATPNRTTPILTAPAARPAIDYDLYVARARVERAAAFRDAFSALWSTGKSVATPKAPVRPLAGANA
jgi:hypothetical protein